MPMSISYIGDGGIKSRGDGVVTGSELIEVNDIIYEFPDKIKKIIYQICDLTSISGLDISTPELEKLSAQDKKASKINPNMFIVVVGQKDITFGLARMWEAFSYNSPFETMVFRKMENAQQWIREKLHKKH